MTETNKTRIVVRVVNKARVTRAAVKQVTTGKAAVQVKWVIKKILASQVHKAREDKVATRTRMKTWAALKKAAVKIAAI